MTWFLRNAFLALVAFATLALIVMMAMTAEAAEAKDQKPTAETASSADTSRQIVVEEAKAKPAETVTPAKDEAAAPTKTAEAPAVADGPARNTARVGKPTRGLRRANRRSRDQARRPRGPSRRTSIGWARARPCQPS